MTTTGPTGPTGPTAVPPLTWKALRERLDAQDRKIAYLQKNRTPAPLKLHEVANASQMQMAQPGHAAVQDAPRSGHVPVGYVPAPVMASLLFNMTGDLTLATSDPMHSRWVANVFGVAADLTTFASDVTFDVLLNGVVISTVTMTSASSGLVEIPAHPPLHPYTDLVTVQTTSIGAGNKGLVVHVELAVDTQNPPG
jgi:hypothetical protein